MVEAGKQVRDDVSLTLCSGTRHLGLRLSFFPQAWQAHTFIIIGDVGVAGSKGPIIINDVPGGDRRGRSNNNTVAGKSMVDCARGSRSS